MPLDAGRAPYPPLTRNGLLGSSPIFDLACQKGGHGCNEGPRQSPYVVAGDEGLPIDRREEYHRVGEI